MARNLKKAPTVNMNTALVIKKMFGLYDETNQEIINKIADNESALIRGCESLEAIEANIQAFVHSTLTEAHNLPEGINGDGIEYCVSLNTRYGDYRVDRYINGKFENQFDDNWTKAQAENKMKYLIESTHLEYFTL